MKKRFLIIGGGLAGTFLASRLLLKRQEVLLLDDEDSHAASLVAAGLFNVITGRYGAKSWMADRLVPELRTFLSIDNFQRLSSYVHNVDIYRPFKTAEEYNKWTGRSEDPAYKAWVEFVSSPQLPASLDNPLGGIRIKQCGWIDIPEFLQHLKQILTEELGMIHMKQRFLEEKLSLNGNTYQELGSFDDVIFCTGYRSEELSYFQKLPIIPNKGEVLLLEIPDLEIPFVLSKKIYLIPLENQQFICGSTYQNKFENPHPSEAGKEEICFHLEKALKLPYKILEHKSGIRPTTPNRRPVLGSHPDHPHVHYFGGFGTKGVLLAPHFSKLMADYLINGSHEFFAGSEPPPLSIKPIHTRRNPELRV